VYRLFYVVLLILNEKLSISQHVVGMEMKLYPLVTVIWIVQILKESPICISYSENVYFLGMHITAVLLWSFPVHITVKMLVLSPAITFN
jgi:hypothetical protein